MTTYTEQEYNDLHDLYLDYFKRAYELQTENNNLKKRIGELEEQLAIAAEQIPRHAFNFNLPKPK